jgi:hypothetical protein
VGVRTFREGVRTLRDTISFSYIYNIIYNIIIIKDVRFLLKNFVQYFLSQLCPFTKHKITHLYHA